MSLGAQRKLFTVSLKQGDTEIEDSYLTRPAFATALKAADRIHRHLEHYSTGSQLNGNRASLPDLTNLAAMIDASFWTSLRREEGYVPRTSLAYVAPDQVRRAVRFENSLSLEPQELTKIAAGVERVGLHLAVWLEQDQLRAWGIVRELPPYCLVVEVILPGLLVVKESPAEDSSKYINIAVIQGDDLKLIDPHAGSFSGYSSLLKSLLDLDSQFATGAAVNLLLQFAVSMRDHGRGGILLVVPNESESWTESLLKPIKYSVVPAFSGLADLMRKDPAGKLNVKWEGAVGRAVNGIAGLTAVDGATVINSNYELVAFGAKIVRRIGSPLVSQVTVTEPVEGSSETVIEPSQLGGTRHLSAAQFVHDQRDSIALVASQDGSFNVFAWSPNEQMVRAHRIDALLL